MSERVVKGNDENEETFSFSFFSFSFSFFDNSFGPVSDSAPSSRAAVSLDTSLVTSGGGVDCSGRVHNQHIAISENRGWVDPLGSGASSSCSSSSFSVFFPLPFLPFLGFAFVGPNSSSSRSSGSTSAGFFGALISPLALAASVSDPSPGGGPSAKDTSVSFFFLSFFPPFFFWDAFNVDCMPRSGDVR